MHIVHPTYVTLAVATHPAEPKDYSAPTVMGFGMLAITKLEANGWRFGLSSGVADMIDDEERVITELADALTHPRFFIGDDIERRVSRPVAHAADRASPIVAAHVRQRMARLLSAVIVDLAQPCDDVKDVTPPIDLADSHQIIVDTMAVRTALENRAIELWLRFIGATSGASSELASIATHSWLAANGSS